MSNTPSSPAAELLKFAQDYQHNPNLHVALEPLKEAILLLRAKYATYDTITETLNERGIKVSETTVRKFCRIHQAEMKRLRGETERKRREAKAPDAGNASSATGGGKRPAFSDSGKPGPRIARDDI